MGLSPEAHFTHQLPRLSFRLPRLPLLTLPSASHRVWGMSLSWSNFSCAEMVLMLLFAVLRGGELLRARGAWVGAGAEVAA